MGDGVAKTVNHLGKTWGYSGKTKGKKRKYQSVPFHCSTPSPVLKEIAVFIVPVPGFFIIPLRNIDSLPRQTREAVFPGSPGFRFQSYPVLFGKSPLPQTIPFL
jgi:hypothetical protein